MRTLLSNPAAPWNINYISVNKNITMNNTVMYNRIKWNINSLCMNPSISVDELVTFFYDLNWYYVSQNKSVSPKKKNPFTTKDFRLPSWPWCPTVSIVVAWVEDAEKENPPPLSRRSGSKDSGKEN